jgi:hypothetical protein
LASLTWGAKTDEIAAEFLGKLLDNGCDYVESKDRNRKRMPGTCNWLTEHPLFHHWKTPAIDDIGRGAVLFVTADPGCGKSVLARYLIDEVLDPRTDGFMCYFFFKDDFPDQCSSLSALSSILHQIISARPQI